MENTEYERLKALIASAVKIRQDIESLRLAANIELAMYPGNPAKGHELKGDEWRAIGAAKDACDEMLSALGKFQWNRDWDIIYKDIPDFETKRYTRLGFDESDIGVHHRTRS